MINKVYISKALEIIYFFFLIGIALLAIVNLLAKNPSGKSIHIFSVVSGSMRPEIPVGSAVFITRAQNYYINDIISFRYQNKIITHRLVYAGRYFLTKGDANNVIDQFQIDKSQIIGKVFFNIPYIGYLQESSKSLFGLITFIYIPALIIIVVESSQIIKQCKCFEAKKINIRALTIILIGLFVAFDQTLAFYSTKQLAFNSKITVPLLSPSPTVTPAMSPTPLPSTTLSPSQTPTPRTIEVNQSNISTQINNVTNNVNTGNNTGGVINTTTSSATTTINNQSGYNSGIIH